MKNPSIEPLVSIIVPTYNRSLSIIACINSLLRQTYQNYEIIISDDHSTDDTVTIVSRYSDKRIKLLESRKNQGPGGARNEAIKKAQGEIIFFTDDDVVLPKNWIQKGLKYFDDPNIVGIEGKVIYVKSDYMPRYSDRIVENINGGLFLTANVAYRRKTLSKVGLFDLKLRQYEDRDLALRLLEHGNIVFASDMAVTHRRDTYTVKSFMYEAKKVIFWIILYKQRADSTRKKGIFFEPQNLLVIFLPPLILIRLFQIRLVSKHDWLLFLLIYPRLVYERFCLWRAAIKQRVFII